MTTLMSKEPLVKAHRSFGSFNQLETWSLLLFFFCTGFSLSTCVKEACRCDSLDQHVCVKIQGLPIGRCAAFIPSVNQQMSAAVPPLDTGLFQHWRTRQNLVVFSCFFFSCSTKTGFYQKNTAGICIYHLQSRKGTIHKTRCVPFPEKDNLEYYLHLAETLFLGEHLAAVGKRSIPVY